MTIYMKFWLTTPIFTRQKLWTPPSLYLYVVKIKKIHPILTTFLISCNVMFSLAPSYQNMPVIDMIHELNQNDQN